MNNALQSQYLTHGKTIQKLIFLDFSVKTKN